MKMIIGDKITLNYKGAFEQNNLDLMLRKYRFDSN